MKKLAVAVLITCYNRKQKTLNFLESLVKQDYFDKLEIDIHMLDDASPDGTADAVQEKYPFVNIVRGTGNLFWAGGMRKIWQHAIDKKEYDLFLLFNDDVILTNGALEKLVEQYNQIRKKGVILVGSTLSKKTNKVSYGGNILYKKTRPNYYRVVPDDLKLVACDSANANILLVDKFTVDQEGIFPDIYTHGLADYDYTLTAMKNGIELYVAPGYYGYCEYDHGVNWLPGSVPLKKRIEYLYSHKGLSYKEYLFFIKKHWPGYHPISAAKLWMKTLFPIIWDKFKSREGFN
jgi:GT2 family glycosyltransferase